MKILFTLIAICFCASCKHYTVTTSKTICTCDCLTPEYVATDYIIRSAENSLTLANILLVAKKNHGFNVSIQNVHWDLCNGRRVSAVYHVVRCSKEPEVK